MLKNKAVAVVMVILAIAAAAYAYVKFQPVKIEKELKCEKCETVFKSTLSVNAPMPGMCPKCNAATAYPAAYSYCPKCNKEYSFPEKEDGKAADTKCAGCKGDLMPGKIPVVPAVPK